jgi:hypothetical protein
MKHANQQNISQDIDLRRFIVSPAMPCAGLPGTEI